MSNDNVKWVYICVKTSCGHTEYSTFAPQATKKCPECGGMMKREKS